MARCAAALDEQHLVAFEPKDSCGDDGAIIREVPLSLSLTRSFDRSRIVGFSLVAVLCEGVEGGM
jgi:hypothetical protein